MLSFIRGGEELETPTETVGRGWLISFRRAGAAVADM
jgi:hypothetical protein